MTRQSPEAARAFARYVAVRHRLPRASYPDAPRYAARLAEVAGPYDLILLDAYGVLNLGDAPIEGAVEAIAALRAAGKQVMVVSNSAAYGKAHMMQRYARLGFDFTADEVTTSRAALLVHLETAPRRRWGMMLNPAHDWGELAHLDTRFLGDDRADYDAAEGFLLIGSDGWSAARQGLLEASLLNDPRPVLVGNPDLVAPRETTMSLEPGHFAHQLADLTGIMPEFYGKPFRDVFDLALARVANPPPPERVLMVGDTLHTDILGGAAMGFATALVSDFGSLAGADVATAISVADILPNFVINRI